MLPDRVSNPGPLTYKSGALSIAPRGPPYIERNQKSFYFSLLASQYNIISGKAAGGIFIRAAAFTRIDTAIFFTDPGIICIFHVCMVRIEKSVTRITDRHHEACRVMPNSDPK